MPLSVRIPGRPMLAAVLSLVLAGCGGTLVVPDENGNNLVGAPQAVTLVNLHPDESNQRLYSANFQQSGLIPMCTPVQIIDADDDEMRFRVLETDREYHYIHHRTAAEGLGANLSRYFGSRCDRATRSNMSRVDQEGIRDGKAKRGMSRQGVIYAIGYPPRSQTPSLEAETWTYWRNRFDRFTVNFDASGRVRSIRN